MDFSGVMAIVFEIPLFFGPPCSSFILVLNIVNNPSCVVVFGAQYIHEQLGLACLLATGSPGSSGQAAVLLWQQQLGGE